MSNRLSSLRRLPYEKGNPPISIIQNSSSRRLDPARGTILPSATMGAVVSFTLYPFALLGLQIASMMIRDINTSGVNIHIPEKYDDAAIALHIETHASHGVNGTALAGKKIPSVRLTEYDAVSHMKWLSWEVDRGGKLAPKGLIIEGLDFEARHRPNGSFVGRLPDGTPLKVSTYPCITTVMITANDG